MDRPIHCPIETAMLDLNDFFYFVHVIDRGGFTAAARSLGVPKSTLSHRVRQLESSLGVRLINRTSRQFSTTNVGKEFYHHAALTLQQAEAAESLIRQPLAEPSGTIRFTVSVPLAQFAINRMLGDFISRFPKINLVQYATDDYVDIVAENYDLAIRAHSEPLPESTLVGRSLAPAPWYLFASASYLDRAGTPRSPEELPRHGALFMMRGGAPQWQMRHRRKRSVAVPIEPRLSSNDMVALKQSACAGLGIVALPSYVCRAEMQTGELTRVLPDWVAGDSTLTALIPFRRGMLPSIRAFVDFISAEFPKVISS
jgi:DNA-binding transcriptional LysR family regulator